jgi:2-keto-4-pentenoate hydratase/2-oxohepta-3-ene-1,7-dioic acid hydratase in catechol pathway
VVQEGAGVGGNHAPNRRPPRNGGRFVGGAAVRFVRVRTDSGPQWGRITGEQVELLDGAPWAGGAPSGTRVALREESLLAPVTPGKVLCVGLNYMQHRDDERGGDAVLATIIGRNMQDAAPDKPPILFLKAPSAIVGPGDPIILPREAQRVDYEAELALVIGRRLRRPQGRQEAAAAIFGYTLANDVSARDLQELDVQWMRAKSFDSFCPVGPWIETEFDPADRQIEGILNGDVRQQARTSMLLADPVQLVWFAAQAMTLEPGDIFLTGTPSGLGGLAPGDTFTVRVEGLGELRNPVRADA